MQSVELKVKIKSLAAEARIIKKEEQKALRHARSLQLALSHGFEYQDGDIPKARAQYNSLRNHRVVQVRGEARHSGLAYGFLRGTPYRRIEAKCHEAPNWKRVEEMAARFGGLTLAKGRNEPGVCDSLQRWIDATS